MNLPARFRASCDSPVYRAGGSGDRGDPTSRGCRSAALACGSAHRPARASQSPGPPAVVEGPFPGQVGKADRLRLPAGGRPGLLRGPGAADAGAAEEPLLERRFLADLAGGPGRGTCGNGRSGGAGRSGKHLGAMPAPWGTESTRAMAALPGCGPESPGSGGDGMERVDGRPGRGPWPGRCAHPDDGDDLCLPGDDCSILCAAGDPGSDHRPLPNHLRPPAGQRDLFGPVRLCEDALLGREGGGGPSCSSPAARTPHAGPASWSISSSPVREPRGSTSGNTRHSPVPGRSARFWPTSSRSRSSSRPRPARRRREGGQCTIAGRTWRFSARSLRELPAREQASLFPFPNSARASGGC